MLKSIWLSVAVLLALHLTVGIVPIGQCQRRTLFTFDAPQGAAPSALVRGGDDRIYGVTREGGAQGKGVLYVLSTGNQPSVMHSFTGGDDGLAPSALLSAADGTLYGLSESAQGWPPSSLLFRWDGSGALRIVHKWDAEQGAVLLASSSLLGVIAATASGEISAIESSGVLRTLYQFSAGEHATTLVAAPDGQLYGTTSDVSGSASLFRLSSNGELTNLARFAAATESTGAERPTALVRTSFGSLYVATSIDGRGSIYRYRGDGPLTHLAELESAPDSLHTGLFGELYGTVSSGGAADGGWIFRLTSAGRVVSVHDFSGGDNMLPVQLATSSTGLYGITSPSASNFGTLFRVRAGGRFTELHRFQYPDGTSPSDLVRGNDGALYGTTLTGGPNGAGTVFTLNAAGELRTLYAFAGSDGANPTSLVQGSDGNFYGRTSAGSRRGFGAWFRITPAGVIQTLYVFDRAREGEGARPVQVSENTFNAVDLSESGHIVQLGAAGGRSLLYTFPDGESRDGFDPSSLVLLDGALYGTTRGAVGPLLPPYLSAGTIFKLGPDGAFATLFAFKESTLSFDVATPRTMIGGSDGSLYGITPNFPFACPSGTLWRFDPSSSKLQVLHSFGGASDGADPAALTELRSGVLYGMTFGGQGVPKGSSTGACEANARNATLFRYAAGRLTTVDTLPFAISSSYLNGAPRIAAVKLVPTPDGKLYGAIANGELGTRSELFVYTPWSRD